MRSTESAILHHARAERVSISKDFANFLVFYHCILLSIPVACPIRAVLLVGPGGEITSNAFKECMYVSR